MPLVPGHSPGELPAFDPWLGERPHEEQRTLPLRFLDTLAAIHRTPWDQDDLPRILRGAGSGLAAEVAWWSELTAWIFDGDPPAALVDAFAWCLDHRPPDEPPPSLLWGDVRLGKCAAGEETYTIAVASHVPLAPDRSTTAVATGLTEIRRWLELYHEQQARVEVLGEEVRRLHDESRRAPPSNDVRPTAASPRRELAHEHDVLPESLDADHLETSFRCRDVGGGDRRE